MVRKDLRCLPKTKKKLPYGKESKVFLRSKGKKQNKGGSIVEIYTRGRSIFYPHPSPAPKDDGLSNWGFGFSLKKKKTRQNFDPSDKFFKGTDKEGTLWISFLKGRQQKFEPA